MGEKKTWSVSGAVAAGTFVGVFKAKSGKEAIKKAWEKAYISVCHHCADSVSDPEVTTLTAECEETGEIVTSDDPESTEPRRTLADVVANPPKGWRARWAGYSDNQAEDNAIFEWGEEPERFGRAPSERGPLVRVEVSDDVNELIPENPEYLEGAFLREILPAHHAVGVLFAVLAEVSDG